MNRSLCLALSLALLCACTPQDGLNDPQDAQRLQTAQQLRKSGKPMEAVNILREMQARQPANPAVLSALGYALMDARQPESSVDIFDRLIALQPNNAMAYNGKAVAFDQAGNHLAAQEIYQSALKLSPDNLAIQNNLGLSLILNGQYDQAIELLGPLNAERGASAKLRQNLALAYGLKGDRKKALALNMQGLTPEEAKENMRFYDQYMNRMKKQKSPEEKPGASQIGFIETPSAQKSTPKPAAAKPAPAAPPAVTPAPADLFDGTMEFNYPGSQR